MKRIAQLIDRSENILIVSHKRPDGDSIGSQIGLASALTEAGKHLSVFNEDEVPEMFDFLEGSEVVCTDFPEKQFELIIFLDCADISRPGRVTNELETLLQEADTVNIDHHVSNTQYAKHNFVDINASSTSELVVRLLRTMNYNLSSAGATALLCGIITDTGYFKFSNVNAVTLSLASELMNQGADLYSISRNVYMERPIEKMHLLSCVLSRAQITDKIVISYITQDDFAEFNAKSEYTDGLVNELLYIKNVIGSILCIEDSGGVRISFRSKDGIDMNKFASNFGGGGHVNAAGAFVKESVEDIIIRIKELIKQL